MVTGTIGTLAASDVASLVAAVADPEIPVVTIEDLGILRGVDVDDERRQVAVTITPTYSGCPAMGAIEAAVRHVVTRAGYACELRTVLSPAWTTDWITDRGRDRLREFGIAPPGPVRDAHGAPVAGAVGPVPLRLLRHQVCCPQCGSADTEVLAQFGSTACKALRRCLACREPFDEFKAL